MGGGGGGGGDGRGGVWSNNALRTKLSYVACYTLWPVPSPCSPLLKPTESNWWWFYLAVQTLQLLCLLLSLTHAYHIHEHCKVGLV